MTTTKTDNEAKQFGGFLKSKFTIGITRVTGDQVARAVQKVTETELTINDKHLQRLLAATHGNFNAGKVEYENVNQFIMSALEEKTHTRNWVVVIKSLITFHQIMHEGSIEINTLIQKNRNLFCTRNLKDLADSPDGAVQESFIHSYMRYLEERSIAQNRSGFKLHQESPEFLENFVCMDEESSVGLFEALTLQLEVLSDVDVRQTVVSNFLSLEAFRNIIADAKLLYKLLTTKIQNVLDEFDRMKPPIRKQWLKMYKFYDKTVRKLAKAFGEMANLDVFWGTEIPQLKMMPDRIIARLESECMADEVKIVKLSDINAAAVAGATGEVADEALVLKKALEQAERNRSVSPASVGSPQTSASTPASPPITKGAPEHSPIPLLGSPGGAATTGVPRQTSPPLAFAPQQQQRHSGGTGSVDLFAAFDSSHPAQASAPKPAFGIPQQPPIANKQNTADFMNALFEQPAGPSQKTPTAPAPGLFGTAPATSGYPQQQWNPTSAATGSAPRAQPRQSDPLDIFAQPTVYQRSPPQGTEKTGDFDPFAGLASNTTGGPSVGGGTGAAKPQGSPLVDFFANPNPGRSPQQRTPTMKSPPPTTGPSGDVFASLASEGKKPAW